MEARTRPPEAERGDAGVEGTGRLCQPVKTSAGDLGGGELEWEQALVALGGAFRRAFRAISRQRGRDTHLGESEVSYAQFELMLELADAGELAAAAGLTPATVTQLLERLAESGQVERARSERDRRVVVSRLTEDGRALVEAKRAYWRARWEAALSGVSPAEMHTATVVLERLLAVFEADAQRPTGGRRADAGSRCR